MAESKSSVLIVGAGVLGASTAYHLITTSPTLDITVLDRTPFPPAPAASTDINKIVRADYSSPFYADLAYEAIEAWRTWPELRDLYHQTGWLLLSEQGNETAERNRKVFRDRGHDPTSDVTLSEIESDPRWSSLLSGADLKGFKDAYWNPEAGWCEASAATAAMMQAAVNKGVKYVCGDVSSLLIDPDNKAGGLRGIKTSSGAIHHADKIVLATGAWTSSLMSPLEDQLSVPPDARTETQVTAAAVCVTHYKLTPPEMSGLSTSKMPVIVYGENGEAIPPPSENQLLKFTNSRSVKNTITTSSGAIITAPPSAEYADQEVVPKKLQRDCLDRIAGRVMPLFTAHKEPAFFRLCWDSFTPSQDWLLCAHPDPRLRNLFFAVGGSFHTYKFLPTVGKYMCKVLSGEGNGEVMDKAWGWKKSGSAGRGAHEATVPTRELSEFDD